MMRNYWFGGLQILRSNHSSSGFILKRLPEGSTTFDGSNPNNAGLAEKEAAMNTPTKKPNGVPDINRIVAVD